MMPALVVHGFTRFGAIDATIDGQRVSIPDDAGNRDRELVAAWEAQGGVIPPFAPPTRNLDDEDALAIEVGLTQPGSVTRALAEMLFGLMKGTITVNPGLTKAQFIAQVKARMRS